jgi:hypothetical protein
MYEISLQKPEKQMCAVAVQSSPQIPEITGQEDLMLFLD